MDQQLRDLHRRAGLDPQDPEALIKRARARARIGDDPAAYELLFHAGLAEKGHPLAAEVGGRIFEAEEALYPRLPGSFCAIVKPRCDIGGLGDDFDEEEESDLEAVRRRRLPVTELVCGSRIPGRSAPSLEGLSCLFSLHLGPGAHASDGRALRPLHEPRPGQPALLSKLKSLRRFAWTYRQLSRAAIDALEPLEMLHSLNLSGARVNNRILPSIARLASLEQLNLSHSPIDDEGLLHLTALSRMRALTFHKPRLRGPGLAALDLMPRLRRLDLWGSPLESGALRPVGAARELRRLTLIGTPIQDADMRDLGAARSLETLDISRTAISDAGLQELGGLAELTTLFASETRIRGPGLRALAGLPALRSLSLGGNELGAEAFASLAALPALQFLSLRGARHAPEAIEALAESPSLKVLVSNGEAGPHLEAGRRLREARPGLKLV